jgi:type IV pilus assembly protein PilC
MKYTYRALKDDKIVSKTIEAYSENDVIAFLRKNEYMPIEIKKEEQLFPQLNSFFDKVSFVDIVDFTRQLAIMLNAGLTLVDSFAILEKQISKPAMLKVLRSIQKDVMSGVTFSMALRRFPEHFPNLYIALIRSGEASGKLSEILLACRQPRKTARVSVEGKKCAHVSGNYSCRHDWDYVRHDDICHASSIEFI